MALLKRLIVSEEDRASAMLRCKLEVAHGNCDHDGPCYRLKEAKVIGKLHASSLGHADYYASKTKTVMVRKEL